MSTNVLWPQKTRDPHNHHLDSTVWDDFAFRHGRRSRFVTIFWRGLIETAIRFGRGGRTFGAGGESGIFRPIWGDSAQGTR